MKINVNFTSGTKQIFIVPREMLVIDFKNLAESIGGHIESIEFISSQQYLGITTAELKIKKNFLIPEINL